MTTSEARKRREETAAEQRKRGQIEHAIRQRERRREVVRDALAAIYSGAGMLEADALLDHLSDLGARVEVA